MFTIYKLDLIFGAQTDKSELKKVDAELSALYKKYNGKKIDFGLNTKESSKQVKSTTNNIKKLNTNLKSTAKQTKNVGSRMKEAVASTVQWTIAVGGLYAAINKIKDSFTFTADIDKSLTEIAMVTGQTREEVQGLKDEYLELGEAIKVSTTELANSAVALYRQGLSAQEVNNRLGEIAKTAKVAGLSVQEVTTFVTSGVNAMKVSAQEFNDVLLKTASVAATDYNKLALALQKSATGFKLAGFSLEKAAGTIAVIQEVTQESAESIGSSVKTMLARFNKLTAEGKDNVEVLNQIDQALQSIGLTLQDDEGQFRDTAIVLDELGAVWETLDRNTQNYLGTTIAGVRQQERFLVLMENYGRSLEITDLAMQAAGTTAEQYAKFQESLEGKTNAVANAWERLYGVMVDESTIGGFLDFVKDAVEGLILIEDKFGLINTVLAITIPLLIALKGEMMAMKAVGLMNFMYKLAISIDGLGVSAGLASVGLSGLKVAMGGIAVVIGVAVGAYTLLAKQHKEFIDETKKEQEALRNNASEWERLNEAQKENLRLNALITVKRLGEEYVEAKEKIAGVTSEIEQMNATMADDSGVVYTTRFLDNLDDAIEKQAEYNLIIKTYDDALAMANGTLDESVKKEIERKITSIALTESWKAQIAAQEALADSTAEVADELTDLEILLNAFGGDVENMILHYENLSKTQQTTAKNFIQAEINKTKELRLQLLLRIELYQKEILAIDAVNAAITGADEEQFKTKSKGILYLNKEIADLDIAISDLTDTYDSFADSTDKTTESLKDLSSQIETENVKAVEKYRDTITEALDEEKELIERNKAAWERDFEDRKTISDRYYEDLLDSHDSETDSLKEKRDIEEEIADIQKTQLELSTLQEKLAAINKQKNVRVLTASGWQWVADPSEIAKANEEIAAVEETLAEQQQAKLESKQDRSREATRKHYEDEKLIIDRAFEDEKTIIERGYEDQFNVIEFWLDEIKDEESSSYIDRISNLTKFVDSYNSEMSRMGSGSRVGTPTTPTIVDPGGIPTSKRDETIQQMKLNSSQWGAASETEKKRLADENLRLGGGIGWSRNNAGEWMDSSGKKAYAGGGLMDYTGDAAIHGTKSRPELALNNTQSAGLFNFIKSMSGFNPTMMSDKTPVSSGGGDVYNLEIMAPNGATLTGLLTQAKQLAKHGRG